MQKNAQEVYSTMMEELKKLGEALKATQWRSSYQQTDACRKRLLNAVFAENGYARACWELALKFTTNKNQYRTRILYIHEVDHIQIRVSEVEGMYQSNGKTVSTIWSCAVYDENIQIARFWVVSISENNGANPVYQKLSYSRETDQDFSFVSPGIGNWLETVKDAHDECIKKQQEKLEKQLRADAEDLYLVLRDGRKIQ